MLSIRAHGPNLLTSLCLKKMKDIDKQNKHTHVKHLEQYPTHKNAMFTKYLFKDLLVPNMSPNFQFKMCGKKDFLLALWLFTMELTKEKLCLRDVSRFTFSF